VALDCFTDSLGSLPNYRREMVAEAGVAPAEAGL